MKVADLKLNQKGITLVELVAALALVSAIAVIAWTAISIGFKHTAVETGKTRLQQEANLIVTTLSNEHRRNSEYSLIFDGNQLKMETCTAPSTCTSKDIGGKFDYTGTNVNGTVIDSHDATPVDTIPALKPKVAHTDITLKITDLNNAKNIVTVKTTLTRILVSLN